MNSAKTIGRVIGLLVLGMLTTTPLSAATITVYDGGISLNTVSVSAIGGLGDPWIIDETMTSTGTLMFDDFPQNNPTGSGHISGRWISKTVVNDTLDTWTSFELELQLEPGDPSLDGDGLSFAQGAGFVFSSSQFATVTSIEDIRDYLNFHDGSVGPGESVTFLFAITDNFANDPFYLLQTPDKQEIAAEDEEQGVPEPSVVLLTGLAGLGLLSRRARK